jgi:hypothetical protein
VLAFLTWLAGAAYTVWLNPEIVFFKRAAALKLAWSRQMTRVYGRKMVLFGGSSCSFAVNNARLLAVHGLPAANLGLGAGMGARVLTRFALSEVQPGDTLIMALEPGLLVNRFDDPALGVQFSLAMGQPALVAPGVGLVQGRVVPGVSDLLKLRPGGHHALMLLAKLLVGRPLYRYHLSEFHPSGWQETAVRLPLESEPVTEMHLSDDARQLLRALREWCEERSIRVAYLLPWAYVSSENLVDLQTANRRFLAEVAECMPVLKDPRFGAYAVRDHYADTIWHLTEEGARIRTDELARQIKGWEVWTAEELR